MATDAGRRVRPEAAIGIAVGIVALTAVGAVAIGNPDRDDKGRSDDPAGLQHPRGQEQAEWARGHHGPPPWAHGHGKGDKGDRDDKGDRPDHGKHKGWDKQKDKQKDKDEERSS